jgi:hypothetical protein
VTKRRGSRAVWNGVPVIITCRLIKRYVWTTASIDIWVDGNLVLRSGGVLRITGSRTESFYFDTATHEATLAWRAGRLLSFPFKLVIDGTVVVESRVFIENWWLLFWPLYLAIGLVFARQFLQR